MKVDEPRGRYSDLGGAAFEIRGWLAGLGQIPIESVQYLGENERHGRRTVTYDCAGAVAKVRMGPVAGAAAWELVAELGDAMDRVVLPGATRFIWRVPGTPTG